jgi:hypothetical protein
MRKDVVKDRTAEQEGGRKILVGLNTTRGLQPRTPFTLSPVDPPLKIPILIHAYVTGEPARSSVPTACHPKITRNAERLCRIHCPNCCQEPVFEEHQYCQYGGECLGQLYQTSW